jgi:cell fate (sporulation/competence/biofilm development) regulator YlbF (YheA/YmcA/DUF963 family)
MVYSSVLALLGGIAPDNDGAKELIMQTTTDETVIIAKTRELCQTIIDQPEFQSIRLRLDTFLGDEKAKSQYQLVVEKGDALQQKQQFGMPLDGEEISEFERNRENLLKNPVAQDFLDAQQQMHQIQESVMQFVTKTFELGRVPTMEDFSSGSCGPSCGCGH